MRKFVLASFVAVVVALGGCSPDSLLGSDSDYIIEVGGDTHNVGGDTHNVGGDTHNVGGDTHNVGGDTHNVGADIHN
ncbi:MAG: hypothetical protein IH853_02310 [Bacteroidetes bacterium]|nr:hypothetical protein [Bacteroidota bacterium]